MPCSAIDNQIAAHARTQYSHPANFYYAATKYSISNLFNEMRDRGKRHKIHKLSGAKTTISPKNKRKSTFPAELWATYIASRAWALNAEID
jgi:hypothetical protein